MKSRCLSWLFDCHRSHLPFRKLVPPFTLTEYQVKSRHYKWLLFITENLFKKILLISQVNARAYLRKGRYAPDLSGQVWTTISG